MSSYTLEQLSAGTMLATGCRYIMRQVNVDGVPTCSLSRHDDADEAERMAAVYRTINPDSDVTITETEHAHTLQQGKQWGCPVCRTTKEWWQA